MQASGGRDKQKDTGVSKRPSRNQAALASVQIHILGNPAVVPDRVQRFTHAVLGRRPAKAAEKGFVNQRQRRQRTDGQKRQRGVLPRIAPQFSSQKHPNTATEGGLGYGHKTLDGNFGSALAFGHRIRDSDSLFV